MSVVKGRGGLVVVVPESAVERAARARARLERVAAVVVLVAALVTVATIGVLVMSVRGVL